MSGSSAGYPLSQMIWYQRASHMFAYSKYPGCAPVHGFAPCTLASASTNTVVTARAAA